MSREIFDANFVKKGVAEPKFSVYAVRMNNTNLIETKWNNGQGSRDRQAICVIVKEDGSIYKFSGVSIPGVCVSVEIDRNKNGKWSYSIFRITHRETTKVVAWQQDWETGKSWPQPTWSEGLAWLQKLAPAVTQETFEKFIRGMEKGPAKRWDEVAEQMATL